jgi:hypothetical protein
MEWISTKERLPELNTKVLVFKKNGGLFQMEYFSIDGAEFFWWGFGEWHNQTRQITHWMPLPKPPEKHNFKV